MAHYEPSHLDPQCLQIQLLLCLALYGLIVNLFHITATGGGLGPSEPTDESGLATPVIAVIACAMVLVLVIVLVFVITRKRARGITWFPEGFFSLSGDSEARRSKRHGPDGGEEMK